MKISCSQKDLKTNLSLASRAVPSNPTHPILANLLMIADAQLGQVKIIGFDMTLGIHTSFAAKVEEEGSIAIPVKIFNEIISKLPESEIHLSTSESTEEENLTLTISSTSGHFEIRGLVAEEFPSLPEISGDKAKTLILSVSALIEGLKGTVFAASIEDSKQILTGVHVRLNNPNLEFAATDSHRLAIIKTENEMGEKDSFDENNDENNDNNKKLKNFQVTIPARALRELEKMLLMVEKTEYLKFYLQGNQMIFDLGDRRLTTLKLEGTYPDYYKLIPKSFSRKVTVERKRLINSLELVAVLADPKKNIVKLTIDDEKEEIFLSVDSRDIGNAQQSIPAEITGEYMEIGFNIKYLREGLKGISSNDVTINLNQPLQAVILNPIGETNMTYLLMPVQLRD